jgi:hypothetical protein
MRCRLPILLTAVVLLFAATSAHSQKLRIAALGFHTVPNDPSVAYIGGFGYGVEGSLYWRTAGDSYWKRFWNHPSFGVQVSWMQTPNDIAGDRYGLSASMHNPLWEQKPKVPSPSDTTLSARKQCLSSIYWLIDLGLAVYTNPACRRYSDPRNEFIGSYTNCLFAIGLGYKLTLHNGSDIALEARFGHSSNGYLMKPNKGINYFILGLSHSTRNLSSEEREPKPVAPEKQERQAFHLISISYAPAFVQSRYEKATKEYYYAYTASLNYLFYPNQCLGFGAGLDFMYNYSHQEQRPGTLPLYIGACATVEPRWGNLSLRLSVGTHFLDGELIHIPIYERAGLFYHFPTLHTDQFVGVTIKALAAHADYIEWHYGLGFKIPQRLRH